MFNSVDPILDIIFAPDEMEMTKIPPGTDRLTLLEMEGLFFLKDIANILNFKSVEAKELVEAIRAQGKNPYHTCGLVKIWTVWVVRMKVFGEYFKQHYNTRLAYELVPHGWDANKLLKSKKIYLMNDVVAKIPFTSNQIRHQTYKFGDNSKQRIGVWKDKKCGKYLVDMEVFGPWIKKMWLTGDFCHADT